MNKTELLEKLIALDSEAAMIMSGPKIPMIVVGGTALILGGFINRSTEDIDAISRYPELEAILGKYEVNTRSNAYSDSIAENYEDRLIKVDIETKVIDYYLLSLEDLVIMKLFSDRPRDFIDITNQEVINNLNWDLLDKIISSGEVDVSFNKGRYKQFLVKYEKYKLDYKK